MSIEDINQKLSVLTLQANSVHEKETEPLTMFSVLFESHAIFPAARIVRHGFHTRTGSHEDQMINPRR